MHEMPRSTQRRKENHPEEDPNNPKAGQHQGISNGEQGWR